MDKISEEKYILVTLTLRFFPPWWFFLVNSFNFCDDSFTQVFHKNASAKTACFSGCVDCAISYLVEKNSASNINYAHNCRPDKKKDGYLVCQWTSKLILKISL